MDQKLFVWKNIFNKNRWNNIRIKDQAINVEYRRGKYLVQSPCTFLSMTFINLIHYQKLPLVHAFMQTMFNSCSMFNLLTDNNLGKLKIFAETSLKTMKEWYSENGLTMNSNKTQCVLFQHQISTNGPRRSK